MSKYDILKLPKYLVIVESPAKCKKIEQYLGSAYTCIASYGHLRTLKTIKDIDVLNGFEPTYTTYDDAIKTNQIKKIKEEIAKADEVILASDDDREGEAIAWHLCMLFNLPVETTKRIIFHEITEDAFIKAIGAPTKINMDVVRSQQARQILDMLVGFTISPLLWRLIQTNKDNALSAGRCQTPALKLVYDNYKEIQQTKGIKSFNTTGYFTKLVLPFTLNKEYENEDDMEYFLENTVNHDHVISRSEPKCVVKPTHEPFTTSSIQQAVSNEFHYSPKETMRICQTLYENGLITYMRTDSKKFCLTFIDSCKDYITKTYSDKYVDTAKCDKISSSDKQPTEIKPTEIKPTETKPTETKPTKKTKNAKTPPQVSPPSVSQSLAQEAHEAIRPTNILFTPNHADWSTKTNLEAKELKIYDFIWRHSLECLMPDATFSSFTTSVSAFDNNIFKYSSEQVIFPGWLIVANKYEKTSKDYAYLISLKQNATTEYKKVTSFQTVKNLKSHYSEAHLVSLLEKQGIGRPSTYASLIDKIQERNYVKKEDVPGKLVACKDYSLEEDTLTETSTNRIIGNEKNKLVVQQLGVIVIEFLEKHFEPLFNYNYTKIMEDALDKISTGEHVWSDLCKSCYDQLIVLMEPLKNKHKLEIVIDNLHSYIVSKNGPVIKRTDPSGAVSFIPVKPDIDIKKLENGEYKLEDIAIAANSDSMIKTLGVYKGDDLIIKKGKYGLYAIYGENKLSLSCFGNRPIENITYGQVFLILEQDGLLKPSYFKDQKKLKIVREISSSLTIRKGNWGNYVHYKTTQMNTPKFFDMKTFEQDTKSKAHDCDISIIKQWVLNKHNVK